METNTQGIQDSSRHSVNLLRIPFASCELLTFNAVSSLYRHLEASLSAAWSKVNDLHWVKGANTDVQDLIAAD
jgi:hypothetical protein